MLAGGVDVPGPRALQALQAGAAAGAALAQGAAVLALETQGALERREGYAFAELGSVLCRPTEDRRSPGALSELLRRTIEEAIAEAGIWQGDVGAVFVCSGSLFYPPAGDAERLALSMFSQVPTGTAKAFAGETFAAGFPMECILAAEVLHSGELPPRLVQVGKRSGVEFWMRRQGENLLGFAALVVGCTSDLAAAAVLKSL
jgi:3-oxoacyl-(acyl-carrier-protein) synthase